MLDRRSISTLNHKLSSRRDVRRASGSCRGRPFLTPRTEQYLNAQYSILSSHTESPPNMISSVVQSSGPDVEAILNNEPTSIETLSAHANARYATKDYNAAAELYSKATELQAELNGEMSTKNADLLYSYGRCLYHVAVSNSDVLGSKVTGEKRDEEEPKPKRRKTDNAETLVTSVDFDTQDKGERVAQESMLHIVQTKEKAEGVTNGKPITDKPYFQFTGDENFYDSSSEDELAGGNPEIGPADEEPEDDFSNAYEVLDLARLLLQRRLAEAEESRGKGKATALDTSTPDPVKQLKERLADTHDLQAEISLEGERFPAAVEDLRAALAIKQELFPRDSSILAEAHYKLSLALEFSSVTQQQEIGDDGAGGQASKQTAGHVDDIMREEAAKEMEAAIASCKMRVAKEEKALKDSTDPTVAEGQVKKPTVTRESIDDVIDMVKDMEQRVMSPCPILFSGATTASSIKTY